MLLPGKLCSLFAVYASSGRGINRCMFKNVTRYCRSQCIFTINILCYVQSTATTNILNVSKLTGKSLNNQKHTYYPFCQAACTVIRLFWWRLHLPSYYCEAARNTSYICISLMVNFTLQ